MLVRELQAVRDFWDAAACGERLFLDSADYGGFLAHARERYRLEPYIPSFAGFGATQNVNVLEIGVGMGADHESFAKAGARLCGIDLTPRAIAITRKRLEVVGLKSDLLVGDAETLPFAKQSFDLVYSWGVLHHSPNTELAAREVLRVLRPGGGFRIMVYHKWSLVGLMLWARYGLGKGRPLTPMAEIYSRYLESPGTKAYTRSEAARLFSGARNLKTQIELTHGDLLESEAGQRHRGQLLAAARRLWPRWLLRRSCRRFGLFLLISGTKPHA